MKTYSDLLAIDNQLKVELKLQTIGSPDFVVIVNGVQYTSTKVDCFCSLLDPIRLEIELKNKVYTLEYETAVIIESLMIDNIKVLPQFDYLAIYVNDKNYTNPTSYLGFNGQWTLSINKPFYHWLHEIKGRGWLLH